jgi:hypothetical protein
MTKTSLPGFTAEASLRASESYYRGHTNSSSLDQKDAGKITISRIVCPAPALAVTCMLAAGPYAFFPCFFNEGCILGFATLHVPPCAACRVV